MDLKQISESNEKKLKELFATITSRFTRKQNAAIAVAIFVVLELISYFGLSWPVQSFLYHILFTCAVAQFCLTWFIHSIKHSKEPTEGTTAEEPSEDFEEAIQRRRRRAHFDE